MKVNLNLSGRVIGWAVYLEYQVVSLDSQAILTFRLQVIMNYIMNRVAIGSTLDPQCFIFTCNMAYLNCQTAEYCIYLHI